MLVLCLLIGLAVGALVGWLLVRSKVGPELEVARTKAVEAEALRADLSQAQVERARFEEKAQRTDILDQQIRAQEAEMRELVGKVKDAQARLESFEEQKREFEKKVADVFASLSAEALDKTSDRFLKLASQRFENLQAEARGEINKLVDPIKDRLNAFDENIKGMEKERVGAYEQLKEQVKGLAESQNRLQAETNNLVRALKNPSQRGQWGEMQLETILKHAGLVEGVHYAKQLFVAGEDGAGRPDYVVSYPTGQKIVIDSKAPLEAYLAAHDAVDEDVRIAKFKEHARHVRQHVQSLMKREYQARLDSVDFVVMFLPAESLYSAAVQSDPSLIEFGVENRVVIASPITLITLLRSVAMGWRQEQLAENAKKISDEAKELYTRFSVLGSHFDKLGKRLDGAVSAFNDTVGSLESRVLPQARKLKELKVTTAEDLPVLEPIEKTTRELQSPELRSLPTSVEFIDTSTTEKIQADTSGAEAVADAVVNLFDESAKVD